MTGEERRKEAVRIAVKKRWAKWREDNKEERVCPVCGKNWTAYTKQEKSWKHCSQECGRHTAGKARKGKSYEDIYGDRADEMRKKAFEWRWGDGVKKGVPHKSGDDIWVTYEDGSKKRWYVHLMEEKIGRPLRRDECVHHIDGNRENNDMSNLQLVTRKEHAKIHAVERNFKGG
jgi:ribosomal protein L37AE/L43A